MSMFGVLLNSIRVLTGSPRYGFLGVFLAMVYMSEVSLNPISLYADDTREGHDTLQATNNPSGVYLADDGTEAVICKPEDTSLYIMRYSKPDESPLMLYLEGNPSLLRPVGLELTAQMNGASVSICGDGSQLYAQTATRKLYCDGASGTRSSSVGNENISLTDSPEDVEANELMNSYQTLWQRMRRSKIVITNNVLQIASPGVVQWRSFNKQKSLSQDETHEFTEREAAFNKSLMSMRDFTTNECTIEGKP